MVPIPRVITQITLESFKNCKADTEVGCLKPAR